MAVDPEFIAAVATSNVCALYYALCDEYPLRLRIPRTTMAKTAVLEAADCPAKLPPMTMTSCIFTTFPQSSCNVICYI